MARRAHHLGSWLVLAVVALQAVHTIPARQRYFSHLAGHGPGLAVRAYVALVPVLAALVYVLFASRTFDPRGFTRLRIPRPLPAGIAFLAAAYLGVSALDYLGFRCFYPGVPVPFALPADFATVMALCLLAGFLVALFDGLEGRRQSAAFRSLEAEQARLEAAARLVAAQLDPQALFNVLGTAESLVEDERAGRILKATGGYLQGLLDTARARTQPLSRERQVIQQFLDIQRILIGDRLFLEWDWDARTDEVRVPPLILQALVERAVKDGIRPSPQGGLVRIASRILEDRLLLSVANSGCPPSALGHGTGFENLRDRLFFVYGSAAEFSFQRRGLWTHAEISIPMGLPCAC